MQQPSEPTLPESKASSVRTQAWDKRPFVEVTCQYCGKKRETRMWQTAKWCGPRCNWQARREQGCYDTKMTCTVCETQFDARPNRGKKFRTTCSNRCRDIKVSKKVSRKSADEVLAIRKLGSEGLPQVKIAAQFGISQNVVSRILRRTGFAWVHDPAGAQLPPQPVAP